MARICGEIRAARAILVNARAWVVLLRDGQSVRPEGSRSYAALQPSSGLYVAALRAPI